MKNILLLCSILFSTSLFAQVFTNVSTTHLPYEHTTSFSQDVKSADLDSDGDLDIVVAASGQRNMIFFNDNGSFIRDTARLLPMATTYPFPFTGEDSRNVALADFDGDSDIDMLFVSRSSSFHEYLINDGTGKFTFSTDYTFTKNNPVETVLVGDIGGDTLPDVILGDYFGLEIYINDGDGTFTEATGTYLSGTPTGYQTEDLEWADLDGDGDLDLIEGVNGKGCTVYLNDNGVFNQKDNNIPALTGLVDTKNITPADVDNDGDIDIYISKNDNGSNARDVLLLNDGTGQFTDASAQLPFSFVSTYDAAFLDLNFDGYLDIICTLQGQTDNYKTLINNPNNPGNFSDANIYIPSSLSIANGLCIHLADFNTDGKPDVYFGNTSGISGNNSIAGYDRLLFSIVGTNTTNIRSDINIKVFPNPTSNSINIENKDDLRFQKVALYNMIGQVVQEKFTEQNSNIQLDISDVETGIYMLIIQIDNQTVFTEKIVVRD